VFLAGNPKLINAPRLASGAKPYARLDLERQPMSARALDRPKKQGTRLLKAECGEEGCGYTVRVAAKWVKEVGAPLCPRHGSPMAVDLPKDGAEQIQGVSLYFCPFNRRYALGLVDAYENEVTNRVLLVFDNLVQEADDAADQSYADTGDEGTAREQGFSVYSDLKFVRDQVTGLAIAGLYHLWERRIKEFLVGEYRHCGKPTGKVFNADFRKLEAVLQEVHWPIKTEAFYSDLNRLRLVANVVKHGDGGSCKELLKLEKELEKQGKAPDMFFDFGHPWANDRRGSSDLSFEREHFPRFANAVRRFFEQFPERLPPR